MNEADFLRHRLAEWLSAELKMTKRVTDETEPSDYLRAYATGKEVAILKLAVRFLTAEEQNKLLEEYK